MSCEQIETPIYRQLCREITLETEAGNAFLASLLNQQGQTTRNFVNGQVNGLYTFISGINTAIQNQTRQSEIWVRQAVQSEAQNTRNTVTNAQNSIQNMLAGGFQSISRYLGDITADFDGLADEITSSNSQAIQQAESNLAGDIALQALNVIDSVNRATDPIRDEVNRVAGEVSTLATNIGDEINRIVGDIGEGIVDALRSLFQPFIDWLEGVIAEIVQFYTTNVAPIQDETKHKTLLPHELLLDIIQADNFSYVDFVNKTTQVREGTGFVSFVMFAVLLLPNVFGAASSLFYPFSEHLRIESSKLNPHKLLSEVDLIRGFWRGTVTPDKIANHLLGYGYASEDIHVLLNTSNQILGEGEVRELFLRGLIDRTTNDDMLSQLGWRDSDIDKIHQLYEVLPPLQDVIRFAVREVFSPQARNLFGLDEDYPELLTEEARKRGLSESNARNYWASHWELPGVTDAFEMFHRSLITRDELETLLKAKDYMPFFRDKLIQLSYNVATRVDTRRLFQIGAWTRQRVYAEYKNQGYDDEIAEALTRFTEIEYAPDDVDNKTSPKLVTRSIIERGFLRGTLTYDESIDRLLEIGYAKESAELILQTARANNSLNRADKIQDSLEGRLQGMTVKLYVNGTLGKDDAINHLTELGLTVDESNAILDLAILERDLTIQEDIVKQLQNAYVERSIDESDLTSIMIAIGFTNAEVNTLLQQISVYREIRTRKPTLAQLQAFVRAGYINIDAFRIELMGMGYADQYVELFVQQANDRLGDE